MLHAYFVLFFITEELIETVIGLIISSQLNAVNLQKDLSLKLICYNVQAVGSWLPGANCSWQVATMPAVTSPALSFFKLLHHTVIYFFIASVN